jgi:hypothetical protein
MMHLQAPVPALHHLRMAGHSVLASGSLDTQMCWGFVARLIASIGQQKFSCAAAHNGKK